MDETTGGTAFVPLATIVAFISNHLVFPDFLDLVFFGQQERGHRAV